MVEYDPAEVQRTVTILVLELLHRAREEREANGGQELGLHRNKRISARVVCCFGKDRLRWSTVNKDEVVVVGNFGQRLRKPPLFPGRVLQGARQLKSANYQIETRRMRGFL